jgi:hypothetical protein
MRQAVLSTILFYLLLLGGGVAAAEDEKVFLAGASTANITPPLGELVVGGWAPLPADDVHDELHARCLVLDDGTTRIAIVLCDNVGIPREVCDAAKQMIHAETGIDASHIVTAATHTHSATTTRGPNAMRYEHTLTDYQQFLARRIADGVRLAIKRLEPAKIGRGSVQVPSQVFNRRWYVEDDTQRRNPFGGVDRVRMNPSGSAILVRPAGPTDPEVAFLSVQATDGRPIALMANYSLHYVGGVPARTISADYFAIFANHLARLLHADMQSVPFVGIMSNGTSGDINNIDFRNRGPRRPVYEKMRQVGELVAQRVYEAQKSIEFEDHVTLGMTQCELSLKVRKPDDQLLSYMKQIDAKPEDGDAFHRREKIYAARIKLLAESPDEVQVLLQAVRIGDLGIATIPFEVFVEIGLEIKDKSPFQQSFTIELANGSYGYLPTPEQHELGGYETWMGTNKVEKQASRKITDTVLDMLEELAKN